MKLSAPSFITGLSGWALSAVLITRLLYPHPQQYNVSQQVTVPNIKIIYRCPPFSEILGMVTTRSDIEKRCTLKRAEINMLGGRVFHQEIPSMTSLEEALELAIEVLRDNTLNVQQSCPITTNSGSSPSLLHLEQLFQNYVQKYAEYSSLLHCPDFDPFFVHYSSLKNSPFNVHNTKVGLNDPVYLNNYFEKLKKVVDNLPSTYSTLASKLGFHVYSVAEELKIRCQSTYANGCYDHSSNAIVMSYLFPPEAIVHELVHAQMHQLPKSTQKKIHRTLAHLFRIAPTDRVFYQDSRLVQSWKDGSKESRYAFVSPYGASNSNEHLAVYVEDILVHGGYRIFDLLLGDYQQEVRLTLDVLAENGFMGSSQEAQHILSKMKMPSP